MHTGAELGNALKTAMEKKKVSQKSVAAAFGVSQPSVSEWIKFGRIGKKHITNLVDYFSDVVGPEHWGLPSAWSQSKDQVTVLVAREEEPLVLAYLEGLRSTRASRPPEDQPAPATIKKRLPTPSATGSVRAGAKKKPRKGAAA